MKKLLYLTRFLFQLLKGNDHAKFRLAEKIYYIFYSNNYIGEWGKISFLDKSFLNYYLKYDKTNFRSYERKYFLKELLKLTNHIAGDTVELGVYYGASSELILESIKSVNKRHHMFDSWEGISQPTLIDGTYWQKGNLNSSFFDCKKNLLSFKEGKKIYYKGWIPNSFKKIPMELRFSFIHFDLDLYEPTRDGLLYFYDKLNVGGIMLFDDYTFISCPGVKKAVDEFFENKDEEVIETPFSAFIVKL